MGKIEYGSCVNQYGCKFWSKTWAFMRVFRLASLLSTYHMHNEQNKLKNLNAKKKTKKKSAKKRKSNAGRFKYEILPQGMVSQVNFKNMVIYYF